MLTKESFLNLYYHTFFKHYFRTEISGLENLPRGGAMLAGNHSGGFPLAIDGLEILVGTYKRTGRLVRGAYDRRIEKFPFFAKLCQMLGGFTGTREAATSLLEEDQLILAMPGGEDQHAKPFYRAYTLEGNEGGFKAGRGGYVKCALDARKPLIPVTVVGCAEMHLNLADLRAMAQYVGLKHIPVPLLGPFPLPTKHFIEYGQPIETAHYSGNASNDQELVDRINGEVQEKLQKGIDRLLEKRKNWFF